MNLTLHHLISLSSLASPFFQITPHTQQFKFSLTNSYFSRSTYSAILTSANKYYISVAHSQFTSFLSTPINANSGLDFTIQEKTVTKTLKTDDTLVTVKYCLFTNCYSVLNGGAIHLSSKCKSASIKSSSFINCTSRRHGGGIYSESPKFWATYLCFVMCNCTTDSLSANILTQANEGESSLVFISSCQSPMNYPVPYSNGPIQIRGGKQNLNNHNYTMNYGTLLASFYSEKAEVLICRNILIFDNIAASLVGFRYSTEKSDVQRGNIINNSALHGIFRLDESKIVATEYIFLKNDANLTTTMYPSMECGILFDHCVFDRPKVRKGMVKCLFENCRFNRTNRTPFPMQMVNTWGCVGIPLTVNAIPFFRFLILFICGISFLLLFFSGCHQKRKTA